MQVCADAEGSTRRSGTEPAKAADHGVRPLDKNVDCIPLVPRQAPTSALSDPRHIC